MRGQDTPNGQPGMRFIVHADDCGLTRQISEDIFACLAHGPLNSTSVIMGGSHTAASLQKLASMPHVRVCLHLNILEGRCSAPAHQVGPLVDENGIFRYGLGHMLYKLATDTARRKKALLSAIRHELEAQIDAFASGFPLRQRDGLHLDGHLHVHTIPALRGIMSEILREHAPAYVRLPMEPAHLPPLPLMPLLVGCARRALLAHWSKGFLALLNKGGIAHNSFLCGLVSGGNLTAARAAASLEAIQRQKEPSPLVEIMCHPGGGQDSSQACVRHNSFYQSSARLTEKAMLLDGSLSTVLTRYGTLHTFAATSAQ